MIDIKKIILIVLIVIILVVLGFIGYKMMFGEEQVLVGEKQAEERVIDEETGEVIEEKKEKLNVYIKFPEQVDDKDHDGLKDSKEAELGTADDKFDSDFDGLSDKVEVEKLGTDPNNDDTDGDGYLDGVEVMKGYNPLGEGKLE